MPNQIQMSPTLTEIWQQSMGRISNKSLFPFVVFFHIMKCTSHLASQHDCLDLCNQMVMREEGVSRVAKSNSNVPHFARDLATEYGGSSADKDLFPRQILFQIFFNFALQQAQKRRVSTAEKAQSS